MARDPGLAAERTELAWQRTGLSFAVAALTVFRTFSGCHSPVACDGVGRSVASVAVLVSVAAALFLEAARRAPVLPSEDHDDARATVRLAQLVPAAVSNILLAIAGIVAVLAIP